MVVGGGPGPGGTEQKSTVEFTSASGGTITAPCVNAGRPGRNERVGGGRGGGVKIVGRRRRHNMRKNMPRRRWPRDRR
eukprot:8013538-Pyramimonas_sp.AAC.1